MSTNEYVEPMVLHVLDKEGAQDFETIVKIVRGRRLTVSADEDDIFLVMERLRRHGWIMAAGSCDVRGAPLRGPQWLVTPDGRARLSALLMPLGTEGFNNAMAKVPLAGAAMRIGTAASRAGQRMGLELRVEHSDAANGASGGPFSVG